jgi:hypothetical protein
MSGSARHGPSRARNILFGIFRVATGRADGLAQFGDTPEAFLGSLAPLMAFPLVGTLRMLLQGEGWAALSGLLVILCALLAPAVLSYEVARRWGRAAAWARFAVAFNWCQWAIPIVAGLLAMATAIVAMLGVPAELALGMFVGGLSAYGLWLHWFLARRGLDLSPGRAALLVVGVNFGTVLLVLGPALLVQGFGGSMAGG